MMCRIVNFKRCTGAIELLKAHGHLAKPEAGPFHTAHA
jgi:hypothetical protein